MLNTKKVSLMTLLSFLFCFNLFAAELETVSFKGQSGDLINLETTKMVTLYKDELQDSTCYRQEPYTVNECGNVTRYKEECRFKPGYNRCWNETDRVCNYETRYRRRCTSGPSRRVCTTKPGHRDCRTVNGRQVCSQRPSRQVCRNVPGREVCRQEPYQDRVCRNISRNRCEWEPGRNVCRNVAYQDYVCNDVVKYKKVPYACQVTVKVPYQAQKTIKHEVKVSYNGATDLGSAEFNFAIDGDNDLQVSGTNLNKEATYIKLSKSLVAQTNDFNKKFDVSLEFSDREKIQSSVKANSHKLWMNKGGKFALTMDRFSTQGVDLEILVKRNGSKHFHARISVSEFELETLENGKVKLKLDLSKHKFKRIKTFLGTGAELEVKVMVHTRMVHRRSTMIDSFTNDKSMKEHKFKIKVYKNK